MIQLLLQYFKALLQDWLQMLLFVLDIIGLITVYRPIDPLPNWFGSALFAICLIVANARAYIVLLKRLQCEEKQIRAVRTMLSLEIDQNLALLRDFWSKIMQADESEEQPLRIVRLVIQLPLPQWNHNTWKSQTTLLPEALTQEQIKQVQGFHNQLDTISAIHSKLSSLESEHREERRATQDGTGGIRSFLAVRSAFDANASSLWTQYQGIVHDLLDKGNPLQGQTSNG